jgi:hypothetical protein
MHSNGSRVEIVASRRRIADDHIDAFAAVEIG